MSRFGMRLMVVDRNVFVAGVLVFGMMRAVIGAARNRVRFVLGGLLDLGDVRRFRGRQQLRAVHWMHDMRPHQQQPGHPGERRGMSVLALTQTHAVGS